MKPDALKWPLGLDTTQPSIPQAKKKKKKSKRVGINSRAKGGRVERELVAYLKERGILSAERTAQRCGKGGPADVVAKVELPSFHIEVKGTASATVNKSTMLQWVAQVDNDCVQGQLPVIFHKGNRTGWTAILRSYHAGDLKVYLPSTTPFLIADSVNFSLNFYHEEVRKTHRANLNVANYSPHPNLMLPLVWILEDNTVLVALKGDDAVHYMLAFEDKQKGKAA